MKLKQIRQDHGLTQKEFACLMGVSKDYIYMLESKKRNPSMRLAKKISSYFKVKMDDIFFDS